MPQNGIHAIVGTVVSRNWMPKKEWLVLGVVLGNMFPDLDNFVVDGQAERQQIVTPRG
jgi:hypothetical protein